tara:strand:+ start:2102 stop:4309 length:2208 start_codon:yes stop_codon:yes gene_type:complete
LNTKEYIESKGFLIRGTTIYRVDTPKEVRGILNEKSFFFFSSNVYPFKQGLNFFEDKTIVDAKEQREYVQQIRQDRRNDFNIGLASYLDHTIEDSIFSKWLKTKLPEGKFNNHYGIRGVKTGYMEDSTVFPIIDINEGVITAQIIRYKLDGKRSKEKYSTNWLHSYKHIKQALKLKDTDAYSVKIKSFFGENLLRGSVNPIIIVEAPKTAVIMKELYPDIDFLATFGESGLMNKDLEVLKGKDVILFPDAHTTKWRKFALKNNFKCSNILDDKDVAAGSDLADFIFNNESAIYSKIDELLKDMTSNGYFVRGLGLEYKVIGNDIGYFLTVPKTTVLNKIITTVNTLNKTDHNFSGLDFNIYDNKFEHYSANIDWYGLSIVQDDNFTVPEWVFLKNLEKCFRLLKEFNPVNYIDIYKTSIRGLRKSNYSFNEEYVLQILVPSWDSYDVDLKQFRKLRNWVYKSKSHVTRKDFITKLNNDRFRKMLEMRLLAFQDVLKEDRFIHLETDLALKCNDAGYEGLKDLVKEYNTEFVGCKTVKSFFNKVAFDDSIKKRTKNIGVYSTNILCTPIKSVRKSITVAKAIKISGLTNKATVKHFLQFTPDRFVKDSTITIVDNFIDNLLNITPIRTVVNGKTSITDFEIDNRKILTDTELMSKNGQTWNDAFGDDDKKYLELLDYIKTFSYKDRFDTFYNPKTQTDLRSELITCWFNGEIKPNLKLEKVNKQGKLIESYSKLIA